MAANPIDYFAIQNTLARYCVALDSKNFALLNYVFAPNVDAIYPFSGPIQGVQAIAQGIEKRLQHVTSQHALTTQTIAIAPDGQSASATTYFTGIHFGQGHWQGKEVTAWGKYVDTLRAFPHQPADGVADGDATVALPGASGVWLVTKREVRFMGRLGEEGVMDG